MEIKDKIAVDYWLSRLGQYQPLTFGPGRCQMEQPIPALLMQKIERLFTGAHVDTGKFLFYQWGFKLMLNIYTGCTDIVLACSGAGQRFIFLRSSVDETMTVKDGLLHEQRGWVASLPYAGVDYPAFIKKYEMNGLGAESHLLRFGFGYGARGQNRDMFSRTEWGLDIQIAGPTEAQLIMHYPTAVFDGQTAGMFLENYLTVLSSMAEDTGTPVGALDFLAADQKQMVEAFSRPEAIFPISETVMQRFLQQASLTPDKTAVVFDGRSLTYAGLQAKAMAVAWRLKYTHSIEPGDTVAMMLYRSEYLAIAVLGILWAGGIHVAIDPDYPPERRSFILKDSGAKMMLTEQFFLEDGRECDESLPLPVTDPSAGAFIIYTSGSTGTPKGILQTHRCLFNTVMRQVDHGGFERGLRVLQYSSIGFDVFIAHELF
ncbi:MAG TPA: AMP-binding protein, partial [Puia sp.]|nr:AMP-binding protein [Puia sp.]